MKIFFAIVIFGLIGITIIVMIVINFMYHNIKKLREEVEDRYYRNLKRKEQKEKNPFGDDYFKSSNKKQSARAQRQYAQREQKANSNTTTRRWCHYYRRSQRGEENLQPRRRRIR